MIIESARDALETGPLCNSCLGRCFANRSFDLTNSTRGQSLRTTIHLIDDTSYEEPTEPCWVCDGYCDRYGEWAAKVLEELSDIEFQTFQIGTRPPPLIEENEALLHEEIELSEDSSEKFKREFNREVGKRVENELEKEVDFERPDIKILLKLAANEVEISINPAFVYGRYRKFSREIPQTEWPCSECNGTGYIEGDECSICDGSGYRYEESVEQLTTPPVREAMDGDEAIFHGAGREDIDAKMLGSGRPFVIEVKNPRHRKIDVDTLESKINEYAGEKVEVDNLRLATYEMVERVKELSASKTYRIQVEFSNPVEQENFEQAIERLEGATIEQRTPQRVSHRRSDKIRERDVYAIDGELLDPTHAEITVKGEGGLYIKELMTGDGGRTSPSLAGQIGMRTQPLKLDVIDVEGEDEEFENEEYFR